MKGERNGKLCLHKFTFPNRILPLRGLGRAEPYRTLRCACYRTAKGLQDAHFVRYRTLRCACYRTFAKANYRMLASELEDVHCKYIDRPPPLHSAYAPFRSSPLKWGQCFFS